MFKSYDQFNESFVPGNQTQVKAFTEKLMRYAKFSPNVIKLHPLEEQTGKVDGKSYREEGYTFLIDTNTKDGSTPKALSYRVFVPLWLEYWNSRNGPTVETFGKDEFSIDNTNLISTPQDDECDIIRNFIEACELYDDNITEFIVDACKKINSDEDMKEILQDFRGQITGKSIGVLEAYTKDGGNDNFKNVTKVLTELGFGFKVDRKNDTEKFFRLYTSPCNDYFLEITPYNVTLRKKLFSPAGIVMNQSSSFNIDNLEETREYFVNFIEECMRDKPFGEDFPSLTEEDFPHEAIAYMQNSRGARSGKKLGITEDYSTATVSKEDVMSIAMSLRDLDIFCRRYVMPGHTIECILPYAGRVTWDFKGKPSDKFLSALVEIVGHERRKNHMVDKDICKIDYRTAAGDTIDIEVYMTDFKLRCKAYCPDNETSPGFLKLKHALEKYEMTQVPSLRGASLGARVGITESESTDAINIASKQIVEKFLKDCDFMEDVINAIGYKVAIRYLTFRSQRGRGGGVTGMGYKADWQETKTSDLESEVALFLDQQLQHDKPEKKWFLRGTFRPVGDLGFESDVTGPFRVIVALNLDLTTETALEIGRDKFFTKMFAKDDQTFHPSIAKKLRSKFDKRVVKIEKLPSLSPHPYRGHQTGRMLGITEKTIHVMNFNEWRLNEARLKEEAESTIMTGPIPAEEMEWAAKLMAIRNMALDWHLDRVKKLSDLDRAWDQAAGDVESETGTSAEPERKDWLKTVKKDGKKADSYITQEWNKFKHKIRGGITGDKTGITEAGLAPMRKDAKLKELEAELKDTDPGSHERLEVLAKINAYVMSKK